MSNQQENSFDNKLFLLGGLVTLILTFSALLNLNNKSTAISLLLFLPIPIYFVYTGLKKITHQIEDFFSQDLKNNLFFDSFSFKEFFLQTDGTFLLNLLLISLSLTILMYQASLHFLK